MNSSEITENRGLSQLIQYWHDKDPPDTVVGALASFRQHNPDMEQLVFDQASAEELIAKTHGAREVAAFHACVPPAMQADYFRYCAVHAMGGVYADANFSCVRGLEALIAAPDSGVLFGRQDPLPEFLAAAYSWPYPVGPFRALPNGLFAFRDRGHPLPGLALQVATANIENRVAKGRAGVWVTTGPGIFTSLYLLRELGSFDAFLEYAADSVIAPSAPLLCEVVGDYATVGRMWDGVGIRPLAQRDTWVFKTKERFDETHWLRSKDSIYRRLEG